MYAWYIPFMQVNVFILSCIDMYSGSANVIDKDTRDEGDKLL